MSANFSTYVELKRQRAVEQGKTWWFEAVLTDEEAHLRSVLEGASNCNWCRFMRFDGKYDCLLGHRPTDRLRQICDEWRYFA